MSATTEEIEPLSTSRFLPKPRMDALVHLLCETGYTVIAPQVHDGVVRVKPITSADQIARGLRDEHDGGHYRLIDGDPQLWFDYVVGPDNPKRFFYPPTQRLFSLTIKGEAFEVNEAPPRPPKLAFIGVRPCELAAMAIQDRVFGVAADQHTFRCESDAYYSEARRQALMIAVNCARPGGTCFCSSMGTGPVATEGYDLALTELKSGFLVQVGSERGGALIDRLPVREPSEAELELAELKLSKADEYMGRSLNTDGLAEILADAIEHPRWNEVRRRCLSCGNCTMVCPTCFCSTVVDSNDLATSEVTRTRLWDSCFTHQFSYTTSGPTRTTIRGRYRQWMRHKLSTWWEQFGTSGCVGCGRCITWCPVGIDITEEAAAIRDHTSTEAVASVERSVT